MGSLTLRSVLCESRLSAVRSSFVMLSANFVGLMFDKSCSMLLMYVSSEAGADPSEKLTDLQLRRGHTEIGGPGA